MTCIGAMQMLDPEGKTWAEFVRVPPEVQNELERVITPRAFRKNVCAAKSFEHLFKIVDQKFTHFPIFTLTSCGFKLLKVPSSRARYHRCFIVFQAIMKENRRLLQSGVDDDFSKFVHLSFSISSVGEKLSGFNTFSVYTDEDTLGSEFVFAIYHKRMQMVVLVVIPGEDHTHDATRFICTESIKIPFDKVCSCCSRMAEDLKKCPCKAVRYCDGNCQRLDWRMHRLECNSSV
jgi:hypothetical protein